MAPRGALEATSLLLVYLTVNIQQPGRRTEVLGVNRIGMG